MTPRCLCTYSGWPLADQPSLDNPRVGQHIEAYPGSGKGCEYDDERGGEGCADATSTKLGTYYCKMWEVLSTRLKGVALPWYFFLVEHGVKGTASAGLIDTSGLDNKHWDSASGPRRCRAFLDSNADSNLGG